MPLKFRKGTEADLVASNLELAEPAYSTDTDRFLIGNGSGGVSAVPTTAEVVSIVNSYANQRLPVGTILLWPSSTAPTGSLLLQGQLVNRLDYPDLWTFAQASGNIITEAARITANKGCFTSGDGTTTFRLPDLRGVVLTGLDSTQTEFNALGKTGGSKYLQQHNHVIKTDSAVPAFSPIDNLTGINCALSGTGRRVIGSLATDGSATFTVTEPTTVENAGTGNSENLQPYAVMNYIIIAKAEVTHGDIESALADLIAETQAARDNANTAATEAEAVMSNINAVNGIVEGDGTGNYSPVTVIDSYREV